DESLREVYFCSMSMRELSRVGVV
ncbi:uncharacterized protein METZ01_LOCUS283952, partial [marine metagenome]